MDRTLNEHWTVSLGELRPPPPWQMPPWARRAVGGGLGGVALGVALSAAVILPDTMRAAIAKQALMACASGPALFLRPSPSRSAFDLMDSLDAARHDIDRCNMARLALALHDAEVCAIVLHGGRPQAPDV